MRGAHEPLVRTWREHLPEYASEALGLALFMVSACAFAILLEHPASALHRALPDAFVRRALMGAAMGGTLLMNVHATWGRRSGAHLNPAFTLALWQLGRVRGRDAVAYAAAQFAGATAGVLGMQALAGPALAHANVRYVVTQPGPAGAGAAFAAELGIAFVLLSVLLRALDSPRWAPRAPWLAALLVALYITFEAPLSGMSMNPARSFGSAFVAHDWRDFGVYVFAPTLAMTLAVVLYRGERVLRHAQAHACAKLIHDPRVRCIFCGHGMRERSGTSAGEPAFTPDRRPHARP